MPQFLDLPREIRDMIYMASIIWERPRPEMSDTLPMFPWKRAWSDEKTSSHLNDDGCVFSSSLTPTTCANLLATNRQINSEIQSCIDRARSRDLLFARIDCLVRSEKCHFFTWLGIPLVHTTLLHPINEWPNIPNTALNIPPWVPDLPYVVKRLILASQHLQPRLETHLDTLHIDIRLADKHGKRGSCEVPNPSKTGWAICAALKQVFEYEHASRFSRENKNTLINLNTLVLNVLTPPLPSPSTTTLTPPSPPASQAPHPLPSSPPQPPPSSPVMEPLDGRAVDNAARELVSVWSRIWAGEDFKGRYYQCLLERIGRVEVWVDGEVVGKRDLGRELERGRREMGRVARRVGW